MLAYILALAVALGSLGIYLAAFFFPEIHRKNDFYWSGLGLFYALILWVCAGRITGGLLLGQIAGVALLGWSVTQTLQLRRQLTPSLQQTELPSTEQVKNTVGEQISKLSLPQRFSQWGKRVGGSANVAKNRIQELSDRTGSQNQSETATAASPVTDVAPNVQVIDRRTPPTKSEPPASTTAATTETPTQIKESSLGAEPAVSTNQPAGPDMPGASGKESLPVEQIAPEAELAPPAEPLGSGDPEDRRNPPPPPEAMEAVPIDLTQTAPAPGSPSEPASEADVPELMRPNPPDPEIVAEAIEDAQEKHQSAHPPESADDKSENYKPAESP